MYSFAVTEKNILNNSFFKIKSNFLALNKYVKKINKPLFKKKPLCMELVIFPTEKLKKYLSGLNKGNFIKQIHR